MFSKKDVGRIVKGKGLGGPEPLGCFNTGVRPTIHHLDTKEELWVVGPQLRAEEVRNLLYLASHRRACFCGTPQDKENLSRRVFKEKGDPRGLRTVFAYRTRSSAVDKFLALCNKMEEENEEDRKVFEQAKEDAKSSDPERRIRGALRLLDF